jgi:hypothetical protein
VSEADCEQQKMRFIDTDKYVKDGVEYTVTYEPSGIVTCKSDEPEIKIPEPGPGWVSKPNTKFWIIKVSPGSGKELKS